MKIEFETPKKHDQFLTSLAEKYSDGDVNKFIQGEFMKVIECLLDLRKDAQI